VREIYTQIHTILPLLTARGTHESGPALESSWKGFFWVTVLRVKMCFTNDTNLSKLPGHCQCD
jgi:hypothetical protein